MWIILFEMQKLLKSPFFLLLILAILSFNLYTLIAGRANQEDIKIANEIIDTYGISYNDADLEKMEQVILTDVHTLGGKDRVRYFNTITYEEIHRLSESQQVLFQHASQWNSYYETAIYGTKAYDALNITQIEEGFIQMNPTISPWLQQKMSWEFKQMNVRLQEIVATNEHKKWFFNAGGMHTKLFKNLFKLMGFEAALLVILLTALITNYEVENRTQLVLYATKKGRSLMIGKALAALISTVIISTLIFGSTLAMYFTLNDYSHVWQSTINSVFNWETGIPYITWFPLTIKQFVVASTVILTLALCLVSLLTFSLSLFIKNSYITWLATVSLLLGALTVAPPTNIFMWFACRHIIFLFFNPHYFFVASADFQMDKYQVLWSLGSSFSFLLLLSLIALTVFNRKDVI